MNDHARKLVVKHVEGWRCEDCRHYLGDRETRMALIQGPMGMQQIPEEVAVKQGATVGSYIGLTMAPCTLNPKWELVHREHWCAYFGTVSEPLHKD